MHILDALSFFLFLCVVSVVCCMLVALYRVSASLRFPPPSSPFLRPTRLPKTQPHSYLHLPTRSQSSAAMLKAAVNNFPGAAGEKKAGLQQQSLNSAFKSPSQQKFGTGTRPLSTASGNVVKHNGAGERRVSPTRGIKRSSSGLAKVLGSQEDAFEYPAINISENGFDLSRHTYNPGNTQTTKQADVFYDENDFDSDIDLDLEDPATKSTVTYPALPPLPRDSAYRSLEPDTQLKREPVSSQAVSWPSSPLEHFKTPPKVAQAKKAAATKRRTLPWLEKDNKVKRESSQMEEEQRSDSEEDPVNPSKRRTLETKQNGDFTPLPKDTNKQAYAWNTTASAVKQQQKNLREANKKLTKANEGTEDDVKHAIAKKKKNTVHRIFLSEEQQHVLNLVVEYRKSVFFTGSAGVFYSLPSVVSC
ncbi:hypothetical protein P154DRAFT_313476 [Amniculicola lignicola CBS 123094]|uniref:Uncharacterized protein n=1 Tax=Amniculicola lignicola CBS 123094 TaxID=1392246 RepID=A0A6A5X1I5_9PLEO|nr:hypothetical protein P154DRAFT_313476 [Amniculicola lignicola CBS 123094]